MSLVSFTPVVDGATATASSVNTPLSTIYNDYNGNITDANIASGAAIAFSKISGGTSTSLGAWIAYTPTYTNLTVGNGVHQSFYQQVGKTVTVRFGFAMGSTSSMGTAPTLTLPVTSVSTYTNGEWIGAMRMVAAATGFQGYVQWNNITTANLVAINAAGTFVQDSNITSTTPATWGTTGSFYGTIVYEAA